MQSKKIILNVDSRQSIDEEESCAMEIKYLYKNKKVVESYIKLLTEQYEMLWIENDKLKNDNKELESTIESLIFELSNKDMKIEEFKK